MVGRAETITYSEIAYLKEFRPGSRRRSEVRILFVSDPWWSAILLVVAGETNGQRWKAASDQLHQVGP